MINPETSTPAQQDIKQRLHGGYFLLRTRRKVRAEIALLFLGYNLKRALNVLGFDEIMTRLDSFTCSIFTLVLKIRLLPSFYQKCPAIKALFS